MDMTRDGRTGPNDQSPWVRILRARQKAYSTSRGLLDRLQHAICSIEFRAMFAAGKHRVREPRVFQWRFHEHPIGTPPRTANIVPLMSQNAAKVGSPC
jgi:hypothetical protein